MPNPPAPAASMLPSWVRRVHASRGLIAPLGFISLMVVVLVPLPAWVMDLLICGNISIAVIVLLTTLSMDHALEFSVFPSLLLATTLLRLVINIASTRLILTADANSPEQAMNVAGHVIQAFGDFVAGDSLFVGVVIFMILVIVQFVVITKGATRISEVAARFILDAMPGKQMAIDSDLNAGLINEAEARTRRDIIRQEADFFGAMDGASKFVRGDAVAGMIITAINILGGFAVGVIERGWPAAQTAETFTKLTIGDGLTAQIPSFIIAIASALIVTRSTSKAQLGDELADQLMSQPKGLFITAAFLAGLAFTPLPTIPLLASALALAGVAWGMTLARRRTAAQAQADGQAAATRPEPPAPESLLKLDALELELGYQLVGLVDASHGGDLLERIAAIRRQLAVDMGFVLPPVRIRDNVQLESSTYRIKIRGNPVASGQAKPGKLLAMDSGIASGRIAGEPTKEPAFGLDAWWIDPALSTRAETLNYTVVDPSSVLATHLTEVVKQHAHELLTRDELHHLVEQLKQKAPKLVEDTIPTIIKPTELLRVLQNLLRERVPVRDLETIVEAVAEWAPKTKDLDILTEYVRNALRRTICQQHAVPPAPGSDSKPRLVAVTLDPVLEDQINGYVDRGPSGTTVSMPSRVATQISQKIILGLKQASAGGASPVVLASPQVRAVVRQMIEPHLPGTAVLGFNEIVPNVDVESMALIGPPERAEPATNAA